MNPKPVTGPRQGRPGRDLLRRRRDPLAQGCPHRRHRHPRQQPRRRSPPGYQPPRQMVFCDFYPATERERRSNGLRGTPRRHRETLPQRLLVHLPARALRGPRLRLPLRLPRPPPHGHHPGTPRARGRRRDRPDRPTVSYIVRPRHQGRANGSPLKPVDAENLSRTRAIHNPDADLEVPTRRPPHILIEEIREPICRVEIMLPKEYIGDIMKLCLDRRGIYKSRVRLRHARDAHLRDPARRDHLRLLRQDEGHDQRLRHDGLRGHRVPLRQPRQARHPHQRRPRRGPGAHRATATRPSSAAGSSSQSSARQIPATSSRSRSRPRSAARSSPARPSRPSARTSPPSATAATSAASASSSRSRRKARSG
jgi:hypothetical protein